MAWLDDNPPEVKQFLCPRRARASGVVVVHTAENTPDLVAFDGGAEAVARFIRDRRTPGSYHDLCDSDSTMNLVSFDCEAFHDGTGSNRHSYGVSIATRADVWPLTPQAWKNGAVRQAAIAAARYAHWLFDRRGIIIPPRRITRAQSDQGVPGFISHAERDPGRRTDPGATFPWTQFLAEFRRFTSDLQADPIIDLQEVSEVFMYTAPGEPVFFCHAGQSVGLNEATDLPTFVEGDVKLFKLDADTFAKFRVRFPGS